MAAHRPPVGASRRALGIAGEERAAAHLEARGYRILARNARAGRVEIDLVARRGRLLVFAEVKTRRSRAAARPRRRSTSASASASCAAPRAWLADAPESRARTCASTSIACEWDAARGWSLRHLEGAFDAGD